MENALDNMIREKAKDYTLKLDIRMRAAMAYIYYHNAPGTLLEEAIEHLKGTAQYDLHMAAGGIGDKELKAIEIIKNLDTAAKGWKYTNDSVKALKTAGNIYGMAEAKAANDEKSCQDNLRTAMESAAKKAASGYELTLELWSALFGNKK